MPSESAESARPALLPQDDADKLWLRMASRYGHAWVSQYGAQPDRFSGAEWRQTLAGLTHSQLRTGFEADRLRGAEWPPSSTSFRAMCLSVPTFATVQRDLNAKDRSPFVMCVWGYLNSYAMRHASQDDAARMLRDAYNLAREYVIAGGALPEPVAAIEQAPPPPPKPADPEVVKRALADIAASLGAQDETQAAA